MIKTKIKEAKNDEYSLLNGMAGLLFVCGILISGAVAERVQNIRNALKGV